MDWKDSLRQLQADEGLHGTALIHRLLSFSHNSANVPPQVYDGNDPSPLLRRLTDRERVEFGIEPTILRRNGSVPVTPVTERSRSLVLPFEIRVHVICGADDDGGNAFADPATVAQWMPEAINEANAIYAANGAGIRFTFDPGDVELLKNTLVNQDFEVPPGTNMKTDKDHPPLTDDQIVSAAAPNEAVRSEVCQSHQDRCVFLLVCGTSIVHISPRVTAPSAWVVRPRIGFAYSSGTCDYVNFPSQWGALGGPEIAHETGHYLHVPHTFGPRPLNNDEAAGIVSDFVKNGNDKNNGLEVFDGDIGFGIGDTPPDPGPDFYQAAAAPAANSCTVTVSPSLTVVFGPGFGPGAGQTYDFATDRGNVMSYFKDCATFQQHFSKDQIALMRDALAKGNRKLIVAPQSPQSSNKL